MVVENFWFICCLIKTIMTVVAGGFLVDSDFLFCCLVVSGDYSRGYVILDRCCALGRCKNKVVYELFTGLV